MMNEHHALPRARVFEKNTAMTQVLFSQSCGSPPMQMQAYMLTAAHVHFECRLQKTPSATHERYACMHIVTFDDEARCYTATTHSHCVLIFLILQMFHEDVRNLSIQFKKEQGRMNYVTPTSYLELLTAFTTLLSAKRAEVRSAVTLC